MTKFPQIDRVSADDLMSLVLEGQTSPMVGAMLVLDTHAGLDPAYFISTLHTRLSAVPRLKQRLEKVPLGCGRPIWIDDAGFQIADHISIIRCPAPGNREAALGVAAKLLTTRLPRNRALWVAALVTDMQEGQSALIFAYHHALADGMGGLAVLASIADGAPVLSSPVLLSPRPTRTQLRVDAIRDNLVALRGFPATLVRTVQALRQVAPFLRTRLAPSSLNRPTSPAKRFVTVACDFADLHTAAHAEGATTNDAVLCAVTGALSYLLAERGETLETLVVSVPVSLRRRNAQGHDTAQELGNQTSVRLLRLPAVGDPQMRLRSVADASRVAKRIPPDAFNSLLHPAFRLLARLGLFQWFINHQHVNHTFVSSLRGPQRAITMGGFPVLDIMALSTSSGNVTVSFTALSYASRLTITLNADPQTCADLDRLRALLKGELDALMVNTRLPEPL